MIFFGKRQDADNNQPRRHSLFTTLFVPHIGDSIRSIREVGATFVKMLAMIFAMNGLFPKNHPALKDEPGAQLTLSGVLETAWADLSFTREGLPKVLLFVAVVLAIVLSILSLITALMLGFMHPAHADTSVFQVPSSNADTDLASNWLAFVFDPTNSSKALANIVSATGQSMSATVFQSNLAAALGFYSDAILIIAAFILFYHLTAMVVETAHQGVVMGKRANQIWAPIRLVVAVGLLVPINGGLNSGQYIVYQMAQWGSALATNVWATFVVGLSGETTQLVPVSSTANAKQDITDLIALFSCEYLHNYQVSLGTGTNTNMANENVAGWTWSQSGTPAVPTAVTNPNGSIEYNFNNPITGDSICGVYTVPAPPSSVNYTSTAAYQAASTAYQAYLNAFQNVAVPQAQQFVGTYGQYFISELNAGELPTDFEASVQSAVSTYQTALDSAATTVASSGSSSMATLNGVLGSKGWAAAGSWYHGLASVQAAAVDASNHTPKAMPLYVDASGQTYSNDGPTLPVGEMSAVHDSKMKKIWSSFVSFVRDDMGGQQASNTVSSLINSGDAAAAAAVAAAKASSACLSAPTNCLFGIVDGVAVHAGLWSDKGGLGVTFGAANPLAEMSAYGHKAINAALDCFDKGFWIMLLSGVVGTVISSVAVAFGLVTAVPSAGAAGGIAVIGAAGIVLSQIGGAVAAAFFFLGVLFFTMGAALAYVVPLLPFVFFFFGVITWIACVAEAMVAVPLIALAHLSPEGEGIAGGAKGAYQMVFSIFLRPVMMIFGLIFGFLILFIAAALLNALYANVAGGNAGVGASGFVSKVMCTLMYVVMLYSVANHAFALITRFPDQAMNWMGGKGMSGEKMGHPGHIGAGVTAATGYFGGQAASQMQNMGGAVTKSVDALGTKGGEQAKAYKTAKDDKAATLGAHYAQLGYNDEGKKMSADGKEIASIPKEHWEQIQGSSKGMSTFDRGREQYKASEASSDKANERHTELTGLLGKIAGGGSSGDGSVTPPADKGSPKPGGGSSDGGVRPPSGGSGSGHR